MRGVLLASLETLYLDQVIIAGRVHVQKVPTVGDILPHHATKNHGQGRSSATATKAIQDHGVMNAPLDSMEIHSRLEDAACPVSVTTTST